MIPLPTATLDHLVVVARDLDEGVAWCEATLGVTPGPGGEHPLMGTHNRLLRLDGPLTPAPQAPAYLEIIAINPAARPTRAPGLHRWFDLDDEALQARLTRDGPQWIHWVARVPDAHAAQAQLAAVGLDGGDVLCASRMTPAGLLEWRITVRPDGRRLLDGCLPTLIEWGHTHPASAMPDSGLHLASFTLTHPRATELRQACHALGLPALVVEPGAPALHATLRTPKGLVVLRGG